MRVWGFGARHLLPLAMAGCAVMTLATTASAGSFGQELVIMDDITASGKAAVSAWCMQGMNQNSNEFTGCMTAPSPWAYLNPVNPPGGWWWVGSVAIKSLLVGGGSFTTATPVPVTQANNWWCASDLSGAGYSSATTGCPPPANVPNCVAIGPANCQSAAPATSGVSTEQSAAWILQALTNYAACMQAAGVAVSTPTASNLVVETAPGGATAAAVAAASSCSNVIADSWQALAGG